MDDFESGVICPACGEEENIYYDGEAYDDEAYLGAAYTCQECGHEFHYFHPDIPEDYIEADDDE